MSTAAALRENKQCVQCGADVELTRCGACGAALRAGEWVVERVLQSSDRGRVYVAHSGDQRVALKELVYATTPDAASVDAFLREGQVLASLEHPGIPRFVAAFSDGEGAAMRLYLAQELVDGVSLEAAIAERAFTAAEARAFAR